MVTEAKRVGIFGASGSGKTTKARTIIRSTKRLIVFDPKREWTREGQNWLPAFTPVSSYAEFVRILKKKWSNKGGFQIVYTPPFGCEKEHLSAIATTIYAYQAGYKRDHMAKITLFVDEAQEGIPSGTGMRNPTHGALLIARMGRDRGINLIIASQRINTVDIGIRANLSDYYIFRLGELTDIKLATDIVHDKALLQKMANFQYFWKDETGQIKFFDK